MTQKQPHTTTISGRTFTVYKLPPMDAQDILIELLQALSPAAPEIAKIAMDQDKRDDDEQIVSPEDVSVITKIAAGLSQDMMRRLVGTMATVTEYGGTRLAAPADALLPSAPYNEVFRGDLPLMYQWLWFCLKVQFGNFSVLAQGVLSQARVGEPVEKSPST